MEEQSTPCCSGALSCYIISFLCFCMYTESSAGCPPVTHPDSFLSFFHWSLIFLTTGTFIQGFWNGRVKRQIGFLLTKSALKVPTVETKHCPHLFQLRSLLEGLPSWKVMVFWLNHLSFKVEQERKLNLALKIKVSCWLALTCMGCFKTGGILHY